jgi:hypothetical protein
VYVRARLVLLTINQRMRGAHRHADLTACPEPGCDAPAEIIERYPLSSTAEPIEHAKILCLRRHWFLLPVSMLTSPRLESRRPQSPRLGSPRLGSPRLESPRPGSDRAER